MAGSEENRTCIHGLAEIPAALRGCVLTIGNFDGLHVGHQRIIRTAKTLAKRDGCPLVAMTFEPPPECILRPEKAPPRISTPNQKVQLLQTHGCDTVVVITTDREFLATPADVFINDVIMGKFSPRHIVEGPNFFFGAKRAGSVQTLQEASTSRNFEMHVIDPVFLDLTQGHTRVSSSLIRSLIADGKVEDAGLCLGRPVSLEGTIQTGTGRGRTLLGFPTVNLGEVEQICPADGIYAGKAFLEGEEHIAAISIGVNPTLGGRHRAVEAFLLDKDGNFYGRKVELKFMKRLRDQKKFENTEALSAAITEDVQRVRQIVK